MKHHFLPQSFVDCGETFYIIDDAAYLADLPQPERKNRTGRLLKELLVRQIAFCEKREGFFCAVTSVSVGEDGFYWCSILFYRPDGKKAVRVSIENARCTACGRQVLAANPALPHLYEFLPNMYDLAEEKERLPAVGCPCCGGKLSRHAIWAGIYDGEETQ